MSNFDVIKVNYYIISVEGIVMKSIWLLKTGLKVVHSNV